MLHDLANYDGYMLHSNGQLRTEKEHGDAEKRCQKPVLQQKTTDDADDNLLTVRQILLSISLFYYGRTLSERPCYILPMFFKYFFYSRLRWPNG